MAKKDYHALSAELDTLLESLQSADLDIDDAVKAYERGMAIVADIESILKGAENKVIKITSSPER